MVKRWKKELIFFLVIFIFSLLMCKGFIQMHYTTDTYKIVDEGYINYAQNWFLKDGRIFSYLLLYICNFLSIPIEILNFLSTMLSIMISCVTVIFIKNMLLSLKPAPNFRAEVLILFISYLVVFNFMYIEILYFLETVIISCSILFFVLASRCILLHKKNYFLKSLALTILGILCYQGTIIFLIAFSCAMLAIKNKKLNKEVLKDFCIIVVITIISVIINIIIVKIACEYLSINQTRFSLNNIGYNFIYILKNFTNILIYSCGLLNKYIYIIYLMIVMASTLLLLSKSKDFNNHLIRVLLIFLIAILSPFVVFLSGLSSFDCGRMYLTIGALPAIILAYLYINTDIIESNKNGIIKCGIVMILMLWFIINVVNYIIRIQEVRIKNQLEREYCINIVKYCEDNNLNLKEACIILIENNKDKIYFKDINMQNKMTINEIRGYQSAISGFNVNTGYKLKQININQQLTQKYMNQFKNGKIGISDTYTMYIDGVLIMPVFIW